jgi:hypothetical protein
LLDGSSNCLWVFFLSKDQLLLLSYSVYVKQYKYLLINKRFVRFELFDMRGNIYIWLTNVGKFTVQVSVSESVFV